MLGDRTTVCAALHRMALLHLAAPRPWRWREALPELAAGFLPSQEPALPVLAAGLSRHVESYQWRGLRSATRPLFQAQARCRHRYHMLRQQLRAARSTLLAIVRFLSWQIPLQVLGSFGVPRAGTSTDVHRRGLIARAYLEEPGLSVEFTVDWTVRKVQRHAFQKSYQGIYRLYEYGVGFPMGQEV